MHDGSGKLTAEVAVIGGGPAGLLSAIALAAAGVETLLIAPKAQADHRTTALLASSVTALDTLGVWPACRPRAAPLAQIRIIDATARLIRAPETSFAAGEIGLDAFGYNIENRYLLAALDARAVQLRVARITEPAIAVASDDAGVTISLAEGTARVRLAVGADGQRSLCRRSAGIATRRRTYPQTAVTLNLAHARPHRDTSTEFHTESGPFTLVPLPGRRSSLVCVLPPERAADLVQRDNAALGAEIERRAHSVLGSMIVEEGFGLFPLAVEAADALVRGRIALVGEAAPIAEIVADARREGRDVGAADVLARYAAARRADVTSRTLAVDLLNRSLLTDFIPVQGARGLSLFLLDRIGPLRRALMREGIAPLAAQPRLMRGETV